MRTNGDSRTIDGSTWTKPAICSTTASRSSVTRTKNAADVELEVVEARTCCGLDNSDLLIDGRSGHRCDGFRADSASGQGAVDTDDVGLACSNRQHTLAATTHQDGRAGDCTGRGVPVKSVMR